MARKTVASILAALKARAATISEIQSAIRKVVEVLREECASTTFDPYYDEVAVGDLLKVALSKEYVVEVESNEDLTGANFLENCAHCFVFTLGEDNRVNASAFLCLDDRGNPLSSNKKYKVLVYYTLSTLSTASD